MDFGEEVYSLVKQKGESLKEEIVNKAKNQPPRWGQMGIIGMVGAVAVLALFILLLGGCAPAQQEQPTVTFLPVTAWTVQAVTVKYQPHPDSDVVGIIPVNTQVVLTGKSFGVFPGDYFEIEFYPTGGRTLTRGWVSQATLGLGPRDVPAEASAE